MKKLLSMILVLVLAFSLAACGNTSNEPAPAGNDTPSGGDTGAAFQPGDIIGVSLNSQASERWQRDAATLEAAIKEAGFEPMIQFNDDNATVQATQIENMVVAGAKAIIVCPYDAGSLGTVLKDARDNGVVIINYDLAVTGSDEVDYFVGYNNREVGVMQANAIIKALDLDNATPENPKYIEMFAGDLKEANCWYYFNYANEVLKPYFDSGVLVCKSGETDINQCTIVDWELTTLETKFNARMTGFYSDGTRLDAVLCPSDYFVGPVSNFLQDYGYGTEEQPMAYITGNDCYESVWLLAHDLAGMTVFKDTTLLSSACMDIIDTLAKGGEVTGLEDYQPDEDYDFVLKAKFVDMFAVDKDNLKEKVVDSGFYTYESIFGDVMPEEEE